MSGNISPSSASRSSLSYCAQQSGLDRSSFHLDTYQLVTGTAQTTLDVLRASLQSDRTNQDEVSRQRWHMATATAAGLLTLGCAIGAGALFVWFVPVNLAGQIALVPIISLLAASFPLAWFISVITSPPRD